MSRRIQPRTLTRLLKLAWPLRWQMALSVLLGAATIGASIGLMGTSAFIIATAALQPPLADIQVAIVGVRFFGISRGIFRYLERLVSHNVTFSLLARLRVWFYEQVEPLAPARLQGRHSGDLLARVVSDVETLEDFYVRAIAPPLVAVLVVISTTLFAATFDPRLALTLFLMLLLMGVGVTVLSRASSRRAGRQHIQTRAALNTQLVDGVQGLPDLLAYGQAERQRQRIDGLTAELTHTQMSLARVEGLHGALATLITWLAVLALLVQGIPLVQAGSLTGVQLTVLILAAMASFEAVTPLPQAAQTLEGTLEAGRRLFEVADAEPAVEAPAVPVPLPEHFGLRIDDVRFYYEPGAPPALSGISLNVPEGRRVAIVGPSGAGKTTLANLLLRFWDFDEGRITLGGVDLRAFDPDTARRAFAVVRQDTHLFNETIRQNLMIARPDASEAELYDAVHRAQLDAFIESLPEGYETWAGEQGVRLSGGERQRLALARAFLKASPVLLLDEPTANLDTITERAVLDTLFSKVEDQSMLLITHRLVGLEAVDEILVLDAGRIVERGTHADLLDVPGGLYRRLWELQNNVLEMA